MDDIVNFLLNNRSPIVCVLLVAILIFLLVRRNIRWWNILLILTVAITFAVVDYMQAQKIKVLIVGGKGVGFEILKDLRKSNHEVWMLRRNDKQKAEIEEQGAKWIQGDALDVDSISRALNEIGHLDVVVSTFHGPAPDGYKVDSQGNFNIINQSLQYKIKKYVLITSVGCGDSREAISEKTYEVLKNFLIEKTKAEDYLKSKQGKLEHIIIRPGGLRDTEQNDDGFVTDEPIVSGMIGRANVGALTTKAILSQKATDKTLTAVEKSSAKNWDGKVFEL